MQKSMNELAVLAKTDERARENFIKEHEQTILKMAYHAAGHFISRSDDEWSVSLYAFSKAIDSYEPEKGDFAGYAQLLIRRDLTGEYRRKARFSPEISTAAHVLEGNAEPEEDSDHVLKAVAAESMRASENGSALQDEILEVSTELQAFGFSFFDLTFGSPKQDRTRDACAFVIRWILSQPLLVRKILSTHQLPGAEIRRATHASEKLLEHYRKYLIAAVLILSGNYPHLQEYLKYIREEEVRI